MPILIERPLKPLGDISALLEALNRHQLGGTMASSSRSTEEEQLVVLARAQFAQSSSEPLAKTRIDAIVRERLPLDEYGLLSDAR
jgi:hypothetical protein